jgi:serine protease Do
MTAPFPAIAVQTCEQSVGREPVHLLVPQRGEPATQFLVQDPFGLRKAIVPVFWAGADGMLIGQGTAFAVDPFGTFITADHVIADARRTARPIHHQNDVRGAAEAWRFEMPAGEGLVVLLGIGLIYGTVRGPPGAVPRIVETWTPASQGDDPMAALQGRPEGKPLDFALIKAAPWPSQRDWIRNLPFRARPRGPRLGDTVVAVGYPQIDTWRADADEIRTTVKEGMFAGYGELHAFIPGAATVPTPRQCLRSRQIGKVV